MSLEDRIAFFGQQLSSHIQQKSSGGWLNEFMLRLISDDMFRIQALRFIDTLPTLDDNQQLAQHLQEYFSELELPQFAAWGLQHADTPWVTRIAAPTVRYALRTLARRFMGGSHHHHALATVSALRHQNMNFSLDLLGEASLSEVECEHYQRDYITLIDALGEPLTHWPDNTLLDYHHSRSSPRLNISIKLSSLYSQIMAADPAGCIQSINQKLRHYYSRPNKIMFLSPSTWSNTISNTSLCSAFAKYYWKMNSATGPMSALHCRLTCVTHLMIVKN